jgi:hypothetical protein
MLNKTCTRTAKSAPYPPCTVTAFWLKYLDPARCSRRVTQPPHIAGPLANMRRKFGDPHCSYCSAPWQDKFFSLFNISYQRSITPMTDPGTLTTAFTLTTSVAASKTRRRTKIGHPHSAVNKLTITVTDPSSVQHCTAIHKPANFFCHRGPLANDLSLYFCLKLCGICPCTFANGIYCRSALIWQILLICKRKNGYLLTIGQNICGRIWKKM